MMIKFVGLQKSAPVEGGPQPQLTLSEPLSLLTPSIAGTELGGYPAGFLLRRIAHSRSVEVVADYPNDIAAVLRLAEQLEQAARHDRGEHALVWRCSCGQKVIVPAVLTPETSIPCEGCGKPVQLLRSNIVGEVCLRPATELERDACRLRVARFLWESMSRGLAVALEAEPLMRSPLNTN